MVASAVGAAFFLCRNSDIALPLRDDWEYDANGENMGDMMMMVHACAT